MPPVYYLSQSVIEQLYVEYIGPPETLEVAEEREIGTDFYARARAGLSNLISIVSGIEATGEVGTSIEERLSSYETRTVHPSEESQSLELINHLLESESLESVGNIEEGEETNLLYYFDNQMQLSVEGAGESSSNTLLTAAMNDGVDRDRNPIMLRATHSSSELYFTGVTSPENWLSSSILGNVAPNAMHSNSAEVTFSGILHPINVEDCRGIPQITAQYICIGPSSVFQPES